jgi:hypothetical protein
MTSVSLTKPLKLLFVGLIVFNLLGIPVIIDASHEGQERHYYLAHWEWNTDDPNRPYWHAPRQDIVLGMIDLRNIPQMSKAGGTPQGYGFFAYDQQIDPEPGMIYLGGSLNIPLPSQASPQHRTFLHRQLSRHSLGYPHHSR